MGRRLLWSRDGTKMYQGHDNRVSKYEMNSTGRDVFDDSQRSDRTGALIYSYTDGGFDHRPYLFWRFPQTVSLDQFRWCLSSHYSDASDAWYFATSADSSTGFDGTWTDARVGGGEQYIHTPWVQYEVNLTGTPCRWLRMTGGSGMGNWDYTEGLYVIYLHLYGQYATESYTLWDNQGTPALITDWTDFLSVPTAFNDVDFSEVRQFKIQNDDIVPHTYTITAEAGSYAFNEAFILDNYKITSPSSPTPGATFTTPVVNPGEFSEVIDATFSLTAVLNPYDGYHHYRIRIEEGDVA